MSSLPREKNKGRSGTRRRRTAPALIALLGLLVSACGGGGGGGGGGSAAPPQNSPPTASFTAAPASGTAPLTVQFNASASTDAGGSVAGYNWNFGDNSAPGSGVTTSHVFQAAGTYTVTLTVTDNLGATGSTTSQVTASNSAVPNVVGQTQGAATAAIVGAGLTVGSVSTAASATVPVGNVISQSPVAGTLLSPGSAVNLVVSTGAGGGNLAPVASFTATPSSGAAPLPVQFNAAASGDPDGSIATYGWNFGDGTAAGSGVTVTHSFQNAGTYTVTLTVTDNGGAAGSTTRQVSVGQTGTLSKIADIDVGDVTACAVGVDGKAWCWGPNNYGQLGTGDTAQGYVPRSAADGYSFKKISVSTGGAYSCGITTTGQAYCWGNQEGGRLGDGTMAPSGQFVTAPVPVSGGHTFTDIAAGGDHACAIATGGAAYCWGHNERGQHGTGNFLNSAVPVAVSGGLSFSSITTHQMVTCGIAANGAGYCWGNGAEGNLGSGSKSSSNVPVPISGGLRFSSLRLGLWTACGVTNDGDGYCWGFNGSGELGIGSKSPAESLVPLKVVDGHKWRSISPGVAVTCGATIGDQGFCWGGNLSGERGDGPFPSPDVTSPVPVVGNLAFQSIDADWCTCGVASGVAHCWGPGKDGCVADGARVNRGIPTKVAGQP